MPFYRLQSMLIKDKENRQKMKNDSNTGTSITIEGIRDSDSSNSDTNLIEVTNESLNPLHSLPEGDFELSRLLLFDYPGLSNHFQSRLEPLHWSEKFEAFLDVGYSSDTAAVRIITCII